MNNYEGTNFMIITKLQAGLGNQFFQYASGKCLSIKKKTFLALDLRNFSGNYFRNYTLKYFKIRAIAFPILLIKFLLSNRRVVKLIKKVLPFHLNYKRLEENIWSLDKKYFDNPKNVYLDGFWSYNSYFQDIKHILQKQFVLKNHYSRKIKNILASILIENSISVHIRRCDYLNKEESLYFGVLPIEYYNKAIKIIENKIENPVFYFFSDDSEWIKKNIPPQKNYRYSIDYTNNLDYLDFELMKNCRHSIIANSTFSWWAAWLNNNPDKIIIAPERWYLDEKAQKVYESGDILKYDKCIKI